MKNLALALLFISIFFACRNGENKKANATETQPINIEQVEKESEDLEQTADEIEAKSKALEAALKELD